MSTAEALKLEGNTAFAAGNTKDALSAYKRAATAMEEEVGEDAEATSHPQAAAVFSNLSACYFLLGKIDRASETAVFAITAKPDWWKGYWRAAVAAEALGDLFGCERLLREALERDPDQDEVSRKLRFIVAKQNKPQSSASSDGSGSVSVSGHWRAEINVRPPPTSGSRKNEKLTIRPPLIDSRMTIFKGPMFCPAVPQWVEHVDFLTDFMFSGIGKSIPPEARMLGQLSASSWSNQRSADLEYRRANKIVPRCDFCSIDLSAFGETGPCCECGEHYCSTECQHLDYANHKQTCATIRSQSEFLPRFINAYWEAVRLGYLPWAGERVKNYSLQYKALRKQAKKENAPVVVRPPRNEKDVEVDELSYLMRFERDAVVEALSSVQSRVAAEMGSDYSPAHEELIALALELHMRNGSFDSRYDSPFRAQFKWLMSQMSYDNVLKPFKIAKLVESFDVTGARFAAPMRELQKLPKGAEAFAANIPRLV